MPDKKKRRRASPLHWLRHHAKGWLHRHLPSFIAIGLMLFIMGIAGFRMLSTPADMSVDQMLNRLKAGDVAEATFTRDDPAVEILLKGESKPRAVFYPAGAEAEVYKALTGAGIPTKHQQTSDEVILFRFLTVLMWVCGVMAVFLILMLLKQAATKNEPHTLQAERPDARFGDVQGIDEVVERVREVVEYLDDPTPYERIGARPPRGIILHGPPGTGKTLLARAVAGEADVAFFHVSAASIFDKWFGSTAKRIKRLYSDARRYPQAVVFIDEFDAIGGDRERRGGSGGDEERNAALTQFLAELDGFDDDHGVVTIVATNRLDSLDPAVTRAGRFDLKIYVPAPDRKGRAAILNVHAANRTLAEGLDLDDLAKQTTGLVGADLEALVNEAALTAVRRKADAITTEHFHEALATLQLGPERTGLTVNADERRITAYHEAGHTLAGLLQEHMSDPTRVTIVPRGQSGGHTRPGGGDEDRMFVSRKEAEARLVWAMGGRAAEKILLGGDNFTSGPADDLRYATKLALHMVCVWGMGDYNTSIPMERWESSPQAPQVERQVERLLDEAEVRAIELLVTHEAALKALAEDLLERETIDGPALGSYRGIPALDGEDLERAMRERRPVLDSVRAGVGHRAVLLTS